MAKGEEGEEGEERGESKEGFDDGCDMRCGYLKCETGNGCV